MEKAVRNQHQVDERFRHMDYRSYVIETSFTYGIVTGLSWSFILSGLVLFIHYVFELPNPALLYCGSLSVGLGFGFSGYQSFIEKSFNSFNERYSLSGRRTQTDTLEPVREGITVHEAEPVEGRELIHKSDNHMVLSSRYYAFTAAQKKSFSAFQVGDSVTRRKLEGTPAWKGKNITGVWSRVINELEHIGAIDEDKRLTEFGREWSS